MVKEILVEEKITEKDGKYFIDRHHIYEVDLETLKKYNNELTGNIETCKQKLLEITDERLDKALKKVVADLEIEYQTKQNALVNFKKYQSEAIKEFRQKAEQEKKDMLTFCQNIEDIKKHAVEKFKSNLEQKKSNYESQIERDSQSNKIYEDFFGSKR